MTRPHRAVKVDANQADIVTDLRRMGAVVWNLSTLGGHVLDLLVFWRGQTRVVEIKVPGCKDDLTEGERESILELACVGIVPIVATCAEDVVAAFDALKGAIP